MNIRTLLTTMALAGLLAGVTAPVQAALPSAGNQRILSRDGACEITVPAGWKLDKWDKNDAGAPDKSISASIESPRPHFTLAQVKPIVEGSLKPVKVFEDSSQRLWYHYQFDQYGAGTHWYIGVPRKGGICAATIIFKNAAQTDLAKQIVMSVKPAP
ncbi:MAG: hypothetical protein ACRER1_05695 [Gammaproteobacteria bacterium]